MIYKSPYQGTIFHCHFALVIKQLYGDLDESTRMFKINLYKGADKLNQTAYPFLFRKGGHHFKDLVFKIDIKNLEGEKITDKLTLFTVRLFEFISTAQYQEQLLKGQLHLNFDKFILKNDPHGTRHQLVNKIGIFEIAYDIVVSTTGLFDNLLEKYDRQNTGSDPEPENIDLKLQSKIHSSRFQYDQIQSIKKQLPQLHRYSVSQLESLLGSDITPHIDNQHAFLHRKPSVEEQVIQRELMQQNNSKDEEPTIVIINQDNKLIQSQFKNSIRKTSSYNLGREKSKQQTKQSTQGNGCCKWLIACLVLAGICYFLFGKQQGIKKNKKKQHRTKSNKRRKP